jgi:hypothetical protein
LEKGNIFHPAKIEGSVSIEKNKNNVNHHHNNNTTVVKE